MNRFCIGVFILFGLILAVSGIVKSNYFIMSVSTAPLLTAYCMHIIEKSSEQSDKCHEITESEYLAMVYDKIKWNETIARRDELLDGVYECEKSLHGARQAKKMMAGLL